jgi:hypothetical protein
MACPVPKKDTTSTAGTSGHQASVFESAPKTTQETGSWLHLHFVPHALGWTLTGHESVKTHEPQPLPMQQHGTIVEGLVRSSGRAYCITTCQYHPSGRPATASCARRTMCLISGRFTRKTVGSGPWTGFTGTWLSSSTNGDAGYFAKFELESQISLHPHNPMPTTTIATTTTNVEVGDERNHGAGLEVAATTV